MARSPVLFRDAVAQVIAVLSDGLDVPVVSKIPNPRPNAFVRVRRVGGTDDAVVFDAASVTVEAYALRGEDAQDLCQLARSVLWVADGASTGGKVHWVEVTGGPTELPDPLSDMPRYSLTASAWIRGGF